MRAVIFAATLTLLGCGGLKYESGSWGGGSASHGSDTNSGIVDYGVTQLTHNDRVYLVLLSEGGSGSCHSGPPALGTFQAPDGRAVEWTCETRDGQSGRLTIGAEKFELGKGAVFLVNLQGGKTTVEQVAVERGQLNGGIIEERLEAAARTSERLAAFIKLCKTPK